MMMRRVFAAFVAMATLMISLPSVAQSRDRDMRGDQDLQRRVYQLESQVYQLSQRMERLEYGSAPSRGWVCVVKDSTWGKVYKGQSETRLEAAAAATNACIAASFESSCRTEPACERK
ncbi:hypothetical protein [Bdellovibrio sp. HCB209]|uniref:hypothetical protein n=1 Tax=Bdellovibrio sp. HCB209 TaxID=3394354 RepID=UPI0039B67078